MNNKQFYLLITISLLFIFLAAYKKEPPSEIDTTTSNFENVILSGTVTSDLTIPADTDHKLKGTVIVEAGAILTLNAGTTFTVLDKYENSTNLLVVKQGAKINAIGTVDNPIVFTSETKSPGQ